MTLARALIQVGFYRALPVLHFRAMDQRAVNVEFLKTELQTGITFANLALSAKFADKVERTRANARKAYDTALKFMDELSPKDGAELDALFKHLRNKLQDLGESV